MQTDINKASDPADTLNLQFVYLMLQDKPSVALETHQLHVEALRFDRNMS